MDAQMGLQEWVREHRVTWEIAPWQELVDRRPRTVGLELRLFAQHARNSNATPGCSLCESLHERLQEIATAAFPGEPRASRYEIEPFDAAFHLRPESEWRPEVQLTVRILHRGEYLSTIDECERRCGEEIQQALRRLGVQPRRWSEGRSVGVGGQAAALRSKA